MTTHNALIKLAQAAQILDEAGLYQDADLADEFLKRAMAESDIKKVAGMWANFVSRLGGWARQLLFKEYRELYRHAKAAQTELQRETEAYLDQARNWVQTAKDLKKTLKRHDLQEWRKATGDLLTTMRAEPNAVLGPYDEQYGEMIARVLKVAPQKLPQRQPPRPGGEPEAPATPSETPEMPATPEAAPAPESAPESAAPPAAAAPEVAPPPVPEEVAPETAPGTETPTESAPQEEAPKLEMPPGETRVPEEGWRTERFGRSRKHGWEWQWEVSEDNNRIRLPKAQLIAAAAGQGKILHNRENLYRPTYGTASLKLKTLMGDTWWRAEDDPADPNMVILTRTEAEIEPPHRMYPAPTGQAEKLRKLRGESGLRLKRLVAIAGEDLKSKTDEERLADAAAEFFWRMEYEEVQ